MMQTHTPTRRWWTLWLHRGCSCGRWTVCMPPDLRVWDRVGYRLPDGDRVPWPTSGRHRVDDGPTVQLPRPRRLLTLGQERAYRTRRWRAT